MFREKRMYPREGYANTSTTAHHLALSLVHTISCFRALHTFPITNGIIKRFSNTNGTSFRKSFKGLALLNFWVRVSHSITTAGDRKGVSFGGQGRNYSSSFTSYFCIKRPHPPYPPSHIGDVVLVVCILNT